LCARPDEVAFDTPVARCTFDHDLAHGSYPGAPGHLGPGAEFRRVGDALHIPERGRAIPCARSSRPKESSTTTVTWSNFDRPVIVELAPGDLLIESPRAE